jgi:hypothetical protein
MCTATVNSSGGGWYRLVHIVACFCCDWGECYRNPGCVRSVSGVVLGEGVA